jgi:putative ABC transport system permease protein
MVMRSPRRLAALDRKLLRDLWKMKTQVVAIALVIAAGVSVHLLAAGMLSSLEQTRRAYYERYLFADVWAPVVRAPEAVLARIRMIDGVQAAETRVRMPALFDMPGMDEPASGEVLSLPDAGLPSVNRLHLVRGRIPNPEQREEAVVLGAFADAHGLQIGDTVAATLYGGRLLLRIVGVALSPEYVYAIAPGQFVPDDRLFGVMWMGRRALARAVNQDGAFNEAVLRLRRDASTPAVLLELDRLLHAYGTPGAYTRSDQVSDAYVASEIDQLATMGRVLPPIFLLVAAFLVNVVIARTIAVQRSGIGLMKAFGYNDVEVIAHYLKLVAAIALLGLLLGGASGIWLGRRMADLYAAYFRFPFLLFEADPRDYLLVASVALAAIFGGATIAVRRAATLQPATAMMPPPPPDYAKAAGIGITRLRLLDQPTRMILRQVIRWPWRAALTVAGIAASGALLIGTLFFIDATAVMVDTSFRVANRYDLSVRFVEPRPRSAYFGIARQPGVLAAEPFRAVPVRLRNGAHEERAAITGAPLDARLARMLDADSRPVTPPPGALLLTRDLADKLRLQPGDLLQIEVTEGRRPVVQRPIAAVVTSYVGSGVLMQLDDLNRLMGEGPLVSGVHLRVDADAAAALYTRLKAAPQVAGVVLQTLAAQRLTQMLDENLGTAVFVYVFFAGIIALGVVYNSVRISLAERQRELASLRVLGFSRAEVSYILLGEVAFLTLLALPLGAAAGTGLAWYLSTAMSSEMFRMPFVITPATYGFAAIVVLVITAISGLLVRRQLDRLDLVAALKTGE